MKICRENTDLVKIGQKCRGLYMKKLLCMCMLLTAVRNTRGSQKVMFPILLPPNNFT